MSSESRYARPIDAPSWAVSGQFDTVFKWEYLAGRDALGALSEKGKNLWGPKIRRAYADRGILGFAAVGTEALARDDERVALELDGCRGT